MATWFRKLDDIDVLSMRQLARQGWKQRDLAHIFRCSLPTVNRTVNGITHTELPVLPHRTKPTRKGARVYAQVSRMQDDVDAMRAQLGQEVNTG